ncbi:hypothetical protein [Nodosilinea sp. FACHB-13]|uniref:hypothetical protein n=1 Tax=Cyanophyceae TaxID=3028117 RepID=UPI00168602AD|nr:hypothetical protein [Nodosilinea sp. FACHB-13]MBD2106700.1 hypothetical protein [Nodosilinea sp. FACHB-13]
MTTAETLRLAATIAERCEQRGQQCSPEDAIARARAAQVQLAQLEVLRGLDWDDTAIEPPLPAGVSIAA